MMKYEDGQATVKKEIAGWWKIVSQGNEKDYLLGKLREDGNPENIAKRLLARFPKEAIHGIVKITGETKDPLCRSAMIKLLWRNEDPECRTFLEGELRSGPTLGNRVAAAYGLRLLGDASAMDAMRKEWSSILSTLNPTDTHLLDDGNLPNSATPNAPVHIAAFLASCAAPEAIYALAPDTGKYPEVWAPKILELAVSRLTQANPDAETPTAATRLAVEDLLVGFLSDSTPCDTLYFRQRPIRGRICDYAADSLREFWPAKYHFDTGFPLAKRDRQCAECRNIRLKETGEAPVPLPAEKEVEKLLR